MKPRLPGRDWIYLVTAGAAAVLLGKLAFYVILERGWI